MAGSVFHPLALERIREIHKLSSKYNAKVKCEHMRRLLDLMKDHIEEIEELYQKGNRHFLVETGDLIILCLEVLLEREASIDEIFEKCFHRYEKKLKELISSVKFPDKE